VSHESPAILCMQGCTVCSFSTAGSCNMTMHAPVACILLAGDPFPRPLHITCRVVCPCKAGLCKRDHAWHACISLYTCRLEQAAVVDTQCRKALCLQAVAVCADDRQKNHHLIQPEHLCAVLCCAGLSATTTPTCPASSRPRTQHAQHSPRCQPCTPSPCAHTTR
jgi:hypothetical protein